MTLMEGYKTLEAGVSEAGRAISNNLNGNTNEIRSEVDEVDDDDKENEEDIDDDHNYAGNGYNIKQGFRKFTAISRNQAKSQGLFVNGNLQQLLALNDVLLLVKNQHCQEIITFIGIANLACYHKDLRNEYLDMGMRVDKHLVGKLESVMTTIEDSSRKNIKCQIFQLYFFFFWLSIQEEKPSPRLLDRGAATPKQRSRIIFPTAPGGTDTIPRRVARIGTRVGLPGSVVYH
ncbi:unnamed protein product [Mucor hiemalis]